MLPGIAATFCGAEKLAVDETVVLLEIPVEEREETGELEGDVGGSLSSELPPHEINVDKIKTDKSEFGNRILFIANYQSCE